MLTLGAVAIVAGGLVAAVTRPAGWEQGPWVAAFLVLVAGVAQIGIGAAQAHLAPVATSPRFAVAQCASWNAGGATIVAGTLLTSPAAVTGGSALLVAALAMSMYALREPTSRTALLLAYRALLVVVLASIPIGVALSWARH